MIAIGVRVALTLSVATILALGTAPLSARVSHAAETTPPATPAPPAKAETGDDDDSSPMDEAKTPEDRMQARFPQPVRVGDLIGQPLLDGGHSTIGYVRRVVRTSDGKIRLIVDYRPWLSWAQFLTTYDVRAVAVPIEVVGSMGPALSSIDKDPGSYESEPVWVRGSDRDIAPEETIKIAIARE